jgi:polysaccharide biosynthesis transport protein
MESTESLMGFQEYWRIFQRRWFPASVVFASIILFTLPSIFRQKSIYEAEGKLYFKKTSLTSSLTGLGKEIGELEKVGEQSNPLTTEMEIIRSGPLIQTTINQLNLKDANGQLIKSKSFLSNLTITAVRGADLLSVTYKDQNPKLAAKVVNTLIYFYIEKNQTSLRVETVKAREFIETQLPIAEKKVRKLETELRDFKEKNRVAILQEEARVAIANIGNLEGKISDTKSQLANATAQSQAFQEQLQMTAQQGLTLTALSQSPAVQEAMKEYQLAERQLDVERTRFQDSSTIIATLQSKKAALKALLDTEIKNVLGNKTELPQGSLQLGELKPKIIEEFIKVENQRQGLENQLLPLSKTLTEYKVRLNNLPRLEKEQRELESNLQVSQSIYESLLKKHQEISIAENQNVGNARIVQEAIIPDEPVASRKALFLVTGVLFGSLLAIGTALLLESQDRSIKSAEEARELFDFTLLGLIPSYKKSEKNKGNFFRLKLASRDTEVSPVEVIVRDMPYTAVGAAYRMLQANLRFLSSDKEIKVIVVSSSLPQEGKSTVVANLAVTVAQLGRKVLLIDADMHCPVQHRIWELSNQEGLSNIIVGQAEAKTAIKSVLDNLDVLPCGVIPPNPMALLDSQRISLLIDQFSANYDFVIIDTPSLNIAADALILGKKTDGLLLVARPKVLDSGSVAFAKDLLKKSHQHVLGLVVNGIIPQNEPHSHYYFANESDKSARSLSKN